MEFRADAAVGNLARLALTEHGDIVVVGEVCHVGSRHCFCDCLMLGVHCIERRKSWVVLHCLQYLE